ncbi:DUF960 family protein [Metabacillus niabensis]|uniref:DUF960 family protein n=1 Tax=Metabacillus niabensis TaxID=324854 RepID=UPI001CF937C1|nr:DUF960 family protein [Metabacillus niabensis]
MIKKNYKATHSINREIQKDLQNYLYKLIEARIRKGETIDYLQVFNLYILNKNGTEVQQIIHEQEKPKYLKVHYKNDIIHLKHGITIWVIDDGPFFTMMFPKDY